MDKKTNTNILIGESALFSWGVYSGVNVPKYLKVYNSHKTGYAYINGQTIDFRDNIAPVKFEYCLNGVPLNEYSNFSIDKKIVNARETVVSALHRIKNYEDYDNYKRTVTSAFEDGYLSSTNAKNLLKTHYQYKYQ
jgi:hypothetical protein